MKKQTKNKQARQQGFLTDSAIISFAFAESISDPTQDTYEDTREYPNLTLEETYIVNDAKQLLRKVLLDAVMELVFTKLSEHQRLILSLHLTPLSTYQSIADTLGINYTAVAHSLCGIRASSDKVHGGTYRKLHKLSLKDPHIIEVLSYIDKLRQDPCTTLANEIVTKYDNDAY